MTDSSIDWCTVQITVHDFCPHYPTLSHIIHTIALAVALAMGANNFPTSLPTSWSLLTQLTWLSIPYANIKSSLPPSWSAMVQLQSLYLESNSLTGPLPLAWGNLSTFQNLFLNYNAITGPLPVTWGNLSNVQYLSLNNNAINGTLPPEWGKLAKLQTLTLNNNAISGPLPPAWSSLVSIGCNDTACEDAIISPKVFPQLDLSWNGLTGVFPPAWSTLGNQSQLVYMDLGENCFSNTTVPSSWPRNFVVSATPRAPPPSPLPPLPPPPAAKSIGGGPRISNYFAGCTLLITALSGIILAVV